MTMRAQLILLSGLLCDETVWRPCADALAMLADVHIVAFPGFRSIAAMAQHVLTTYQGPLILVGHSMGGRVAIDVARQAPHRITALALFNTGVHPPTPTEPASRAMLTDLARTSGMAALAAAWLPPMLGADQQRIDAVMPVLTAMVERQTLASFLGQIDALLARPDAETALRAITVPVLLASGDNDRWSPLAQHAAMQRLVPHATLVAIGNSGHMAPIEQPAQVSRVLSRWLASFL